MKRSKNPARPHGAAHFIRTHRKLLFKLSLAAQIPAYIGALYRLYRKDRGAARALLFVGAACTIVSFALLFSNDEKAEKALGKAPKSGGENAADAVNDEQSAVKGDFADQARDGDEPAGAPDEASGDSFPHEKRSIDFDTTKEFLAQKDRPENGTNSDEKPSYEQHEHRDEAETEKSDELERINEAIRILQSVELPTDWQTAPSNDTTTDK